MPGTMKRAHLLLPPTSAEQMNKLFLSTNSEQGVSTGALDKLLLRDQTDETLSPRLSEFSRRV